MFFFIIYLGLGALGFFWVLLGLVLRLRGLYCFSAYLGLRALGFCWVWFRVLRLEAYFGLRALGFYRV